MYIRTNARVHLFHMYMRTVCCFSCCFARFCVWTSIRADPIQWQYCTILQTLYMQLICYTTEAENDIRIERANFVCSHWMPFVGAPQFIQWQCACGGHASDLACWARGMELDRHWLNSSIIALRTFMICTQTHCSNFVAANFCNIMTTTKRAWSHINFPLNMCPE